MFKLMDKKAIAILRLNICLTGPMFVCWSIKAGLDGVNQLVINGLISK